MTEILVAPVASALKIKEELETQKQRHAEEMKKKDEELAERDELYKELKKENGELKALLTRKEEEDEAEMVGGSHEEEGREPLDWKVALTESCLNQLKENTEATEGDEEELLSILNNPTFTILQDEEGVRPSTSLLGEGVMKKCRVYPRIEKSSGTGYLRWECDDNTYYLSGGERILYAETDKITEKRKTRSGTSLDHWTWKGKGRFAKALYYGLEDLINQLD